MWAFVAMVFKVTTILLRLAFEVDGLRLGHRGYGRHGIHHDGCYRDRGLPRPPLPPLPAKAYLMVEWRMVFRAIYFWHLSLDLERSSSDVKAQFFRVV